MRESQNEIRASTLQSIASAISGGVTMTVSKFSPLSLLRLSPTRGRVIL
jgi:hypothetical protein